MRKYWFILLGIFLTESAIAQDNGRDVTISGVIVDEQRNPIPFANIAVFTRADSSVVGGSVSDDLGRFEIIANPGRYFLKITFLSFKVREIPIDLIGNQDVDLGEIQMESFSRTLEEVVVTGERSQMELQLDKRVFNVGQDLSNAGGSAADILDNVPSVSVDVDGTVSLRGSENVRILINGKPSGLTMRDPDALRQLQGSLVERVEVITNPSSRYEAEGEVGIINIILKKEQDRGLHGTFNATAGHPEFFGGSYSINYRTRKLNLFSSYGADYRSSPGYTHSFIGFSPDTLSFRDSDRRRSELSHNFRAGLDYYFNEKTSVTGSAMYNFGDGLNTSTLTYDDYYAGEFARRSVRTDREHEDEKNLEAAVNFRREFSSDEHTLTADFQYVQGLDGETSDYTQTSDGPLVIQRGENISREKNWFVQSDYVHPFGEEGKAEAGLRSTTRIVENDYILEEQDEDGNWIPFPAFNNNMIYTERIHAGYVMAGNKFNRFSLQAGVRAEYSDITTELVVSEDLNHREYFNLFPSVNLGYEITRDKTWQLSYSKRINRPRFRELLPFSNFSDSRSYFQGNPNLNPEYTHSFETGYLINWEKGSVLSSAYYRYRQGVIQRITEVQGDSITLIFPINLATQNAYGLEFNLSLNPVQWWTLNTSANFYRAITEGQHNDDRLYSDTHTFNTRTTSKMTLGEHFEFQTSFNYRAPRITTQGRRRSSYSLDFAVAKDILKGKGTVTANVRDVLNSRKRRSITEIGDYYEETESQWRPRSFRVTFTYRLNQMKERPGRGEGRGPEGGDNGIRDGEFNPDR